MILTYRYHRSIPVSYDRQGYIYFKSRLYHHLPVAEKEHMRELIHDAAGIHYRALFCYLTTDHGAKFITVRYKLSNRTLTRIVSRYYERFDM